MFKRSVFSPAFTRLMGQAILGLAIFQLMFQMLVWFPDNWARSDPGRDIEVYFDALTRLKTGYSLYQLWPEYTPALNPSRFFYPPPFMLLVWPLKKLDYLWFGRFWTLFLMAACWVYAFALAKLATGKMRWQSVLIAKMCVDMCPASNVAMGMGNFEPVMWACYGLALTTRYRIVPLALAAMMKLHPVWVLLMVIQKEGIRALLVAVAVLVAGFGAGVWLCGWENCLQWWPATSPVLSQGADFAMNVSLSFLPIRLLMYAHVIERGTHLPPLAMAYLSATALGAPIATIYLTRKLPQELRYGLVACATILFSPLCWTIYLPLLLAPAAMWWRWRSENKTAWQTFVETNSASVDLTSRAQELRKIRQR